MISDEKRRKRIDTAPDEKLLNMLKSGNQSALQILLSNPTLEGLAAIEETIALYSNNPNVTFYILGGQRVYSQESTMTAKESITNLALDDLLLKDPAYTQSLIASLGLSGGLSNLIMQQLSIYPQKLYEYQLLGVQMQLSYLLKDKINTHQENIVVDNESKSDSENQEKAQIDVGQKTLDDTLAETIDTIEQNLILLLEMLGNNAETASKKEMATIMATLTENKNSPDNSPVIREKAKNIRLKVIGIILRRFPDLIYLADEKNANSIKSSNVNFKEKTNDSKKLNNIVKFAFAVAIFSLILYIRIVIIIIPSVLKSSYVIPFIIQSIFYITPLVGAFVARQNIKIGGWIFLIYGGYRILRNIQNLTVAYLPSILMNIAFLLCIVVGIMFLKNAKVNQ